MRNTLAFLTVLVLTAAGAGWYLGWFQVHTTPLPSGHRQVNIDIDTEKVEHDLKAGGEKVLETGKETFEDVLEKTQKKEEEKNPAPVSFWDGAGRPTLPQ
jgi:hypothetical protein